MNKFQEQNYKDLCSIVDKMDAIINLHQKKTMNEKVIYTIEITNKEGKTLAKKTQFRNQSIDDMAKDLLQNNSKWIQFKS